MPFSYAITKQYPLSQRPFIKTWLEINKWEALVSFHRIGCGQLVDTKIVTNIPKSPANYRMSQFFSKTKATL